MPSSDSFFIEWISQFVDSAAFISFFVGHLSHRDSVKYWEQLPMDTCTIPKLTFEELQSAMFLSEDEVESNLLSEIPVAMPYLPVDVAVMAEKLANN